MVYNWIDGSIIIADVIDRFNIETTDWIPRIGYWIENGLADLKLLPTSPTQCKVVSAKDFMVELPIPLKSITAIKVEDTRIESSEQIVKGGTNDSLFYSNVGRGYIRLETDNEYFRDVDVTIYYKGFKTIFNKDIHIEIPEIPDKAIIIEALSYYVFKNILSRGYIHPVYNLSGGDPFLNVNIIYRGQNGKGGLRKKAMIEAKTMNEDTREYVSKRLRTFLDPSDYKNRSFDGKFNTLE